jgi:type IV secretion system protein VirB1
MTALTAAVVFTLAAQWGQPVAPKTIVAEATVESGLDPLAIHDNTTGRTFHPATVEEAMQIATQLEAAGGNYDVGLMQINRRNFDWLHLTLAGAFDPRRSIEAGAAIMISMSRYNTGDLRGLENGYVEKVLAASRRLNGAPVPGTPLPGATSSAHAASVPSPIPPAPPPVVLDMLHGTEAPQNAPGQVVDLLGGLAPVRNVELAEQ